MANINKELKDIKQAVYGREVRGSIHDGIKKINEETEGATELTKDTEVRQSSLEEQFDEQIKNQTIDDPSSAELVAARTNTKDDETYPTIGRRMDDEYAKVTQQLAETEQVANVKAFGAAGGEDITRNLNKAITYARENKINVYIPSGTYFISETINVPAQTLIKGAGERRTIIKPTTNEIAVFYLEDTYRTKITDMSIINDHGPGENNSAVKSDYINGAYESTFKNLIIGGFKYGFDVGNRFWMNSIENVRWNLCDISFNGQNSTDGTSINNLFIHCYSNRPTIGSVALKAFKNTEFINCNFGGRKGAGDEPTYILKLETNTRGIRMTACNFEHHFIPERGLFQLWSGSTLELNSSNFFDLHGNEGFDSWYIIARNTTRVTLISCSIINEGEHVDGIKLMEDSQLVQFNNSAGLESIENNSSNAVLTLYDEGFGLATLRSGQNIKTGIPNPKSIQLTIKTSGELIYPKVVAGVAHIYSHGSFVVNFSNLSDGSENYDEHQLYWTVIK